MILIAFLAFFGNGYQYQKSFETCLEVDFKAKSCQWHKKMLEANPKSMHNK